MNGAIVGSSDEVVHQGRNSHPHIEGSDRPSHLGPDMFDTKNQKDVMTLQQVAAYLQISKAHLCNVVKGKVPGVPPLHYFRVGRRILFKRQWVDEWMESTNLQDIR
jgi:excisionase family DNA binding protein